MTTAIEKVVLETALEALEENHEWHKEYGEGQYENSVYEQMNLTAIALVKAAIQDKQET